MSGPHFFVWSEGVLNLDRMLYAYRRGDGSLVVVFADREDFVTADLKLAAEFMLHCAQYHAAGKGETFP